MRKDTKVVGPFAQLVTLESLPLKGSISDHTLRIIDQGAVKIKNGIIVEVGEFTKEFIHDCEVEEIFEQMVLIPGLIDCHTHLVWGGNRARDYTMRMSGQSYQDILAAGGGIFDSVAKTQAASSDQLLHDLQTRADRHLKDGVTTIEVKTGYGLLPDQELKLLNVIKNGKSIVKADLVPTCLAAHVCPKEFEKPDFLKHIENELLPEIMVKGLANRVDIFVEDNAFPVEIARSYLQSARKLGFDITIHADQFTVGGSDLAIEVGALSADHLEASGDQEILRLAQSDVVPVALPGASIGLGMQYTPARKLLNAGCSLAIATDWNPGSAPMGDLLVQASLLGIYEKLSAAELLAGMTFRAGAALNLFDRGQLSPGKKADMIGFPLSDFREIFYNQGKAKPVKVWKKGELI
ncbi:MAG: imidazolonepropionase [Marinoscillum sp.]